MNSGWFAMSARYSKTSSRGRAMVTSSVDGVHGAPESSASRALRRRGARTRPTRSCSRRCTSSERSGASRRSGRHSSQTHRARGVDVDALADERRAVAVRAAVRAAAASAPTLLRSSESPARSGARRAERATAWFARAFAAGQRSPSGRPAHRVATPLTASRINPRWRSGRRNGARRRARGETAWIHARPGDVEATGDRCPSRAAGDAVRARVTGGAEPSARAPPGWVDEARAGLDVPGKYLAYEDGGRRVVVARLARVDADRPLPGRRRALRRRDRLPPPRADRAPGRRRARARRPLPQRRLRQRRAGRVERR